MKKTLLQFIMIIPLVILLCFTFSCQDKEAMAELEAIKVQAEIEAQNKELIRNYFEELDSGNAEILMEVFAPNALIYYPSNAKPMSREEELEFHKSVLGAFAGFHHSIGELISARDKVIARLICRGTHKGEFQGIPATGNKIEVSVIVIFRIEDGKIVELRREYDGLGFMMQLGMELKPKEAEK